MSTITVARGQTTDVQAPRAPAKPHERHIQPTDAAQDAFEPHPADQGEPTPGGPFCCPSPKQAATVLVGGAGAVLGGMAGGLLGIGVFAVSPAVAVLAFAVDCLLEEGHDEASPYSAVLDCLAAPLTRTVEGARRGYRRAVNVLNS